MEGKPVNSSNPVPRAQSQDSSEKTGKVSGQFGSFKTSVLSDVEPKIPRTPFNSLNGLHSPVPQNFFAIFEPQMFKLSAETMLPRVSTFNHSLLNHMGFPEESQDFFSSWALVEAGMAQPIESEEANNLLTEARTLLDSAPDDKTIVERISVFKDGQRLDIQPEDQASKGVFDKLWSFFAQLFTSPFQLLSNSRGQEGFRATLNILQDRVKESRERSVETTEPNASIRPPDVDEEQELTPKREAELEYLRKAPKHTPVYFEDEFYHLEAVEGDTANISKEGRVVEAPASALYLPPAYPSASRIYNPTDVDLPSGTALDEDREQELLHICSHLKKDQVVIYRKNGEADLNCTVAMVIPGEKSPQVTLQKEDGSTIDAALSRIYLPDDNWRAQQSDIE